MSIDELAPDSARGVFVSSIIVDDGHVVIADVSLLLVELNIRRTGGHQGGCVRHHLCLDLINIIMKVSIPSSVTGHYIHDNCFVGLIDLS